MLKIKENKIQELEKLGFVKCKSANDFIYYYQIYKNYGLYIEIVVNVDRTITLDVNCDDVWTDDIDIFYELFANDIVEKVEE